MDSLERFWKLDTLVFATILSKPKKIAICPFGEKGMTAKRILNERYGVTEDYIIDSRLWEYNPRIINVEDLEKEDTDGLIVILTADNREINQSLAERILRVNKNIIIQNFMDRKIYAQVPYKKEFFRELSQLLEIRKIPEGKELVRIGKEGNGSYMLLDDFNQDMHVYSFGIDVNTTFDEDIIARTRKAYLYDHTISGIAFSHPDVTFFRTGISGIDEPQNDKMSLETLVRNNGDYDSDNLLLKMDVEGAEWEAIKSAPDELMGRFRQIAIEFHEMTDPAKKDLTLEVLRKLNRTHDLVYINSTNSKPLEKAGDIVIPSYMEATYVIRNREDD